MTGSERDSRFDYHQSFTYLSEEDVISYYKVQVSNEQDLADISIGELKKARLTPSSLARLSKNRVPDFGLATLLATLEMAVLEHEHPQLLTVASTFPHLYRFLRAVELFSLVPRDGNTLMIGSGTTTPEYLVCKIKPPEPKRIVQFIESYQPGTLEKKLDERFAEIRQGKPIRNPLPLYPNGNITAVEPDTKQLALVSAINTCLGLSPDKLTLHQYPIRYVIEKDLLPKSVDAVLWHRVDPLAAAPVGAATFNERYLNELIGIFYNRLSRGGRMIISIGAGNDEEEYNERRRFFVSAKQLLRGKGLTAISGIPDDFEDNHWELFFGNQSMGMRGCLAFRKK